MNNEVIFYQKVREFRVQISDVGSRMFHERVALYVNAAFEFSKSLGITGFPLDPLDLHSPSLQEKSIDALLELELYMQSIYARNVFIIDPSLKRSLIELNEDWRSRVSSYLRTVREIVRAAEMSEPMREKIFAQIQSLEGEIERNRTRLDAVVEAWLQITEAIGTGAKNLDQAAKLFERLARALYGAREAEQRPQLPAPPEEPSSTRRDEA